MANRYEELFNAMKAGEQPAKVNPPKEPSAQEKAPSKESQQAAKDEAMRLREENAPTTKSEMGKLFKKGGCVRKSAGGDIATAVTPPPGKPVRTKETTNAKKGGCVKMKSGGSVSSASKRADGIAQRGKTKGRVL